MTHLFQTSAIKQPDIGNKRRCKLGLGQFVNWGFLVFLSSFFLFLNPALAQENDVVLELQTPVVFEAVSRGETKLVQVSLSNLGSTNVRITPCLKSIEDVSDLGQIDISDRSPIWADWVTFDDGVFILEEESTKNFSFALDIPQVADSGAYYGILSFSGTTENGLQAIGSDVNQSAGVGLVVLLNVLGDNGFFHTGEINSWDHSGSTGGPHKLVLNYHNTGSSIFIPIGLITIRDWRGSLVDTNVLEDHWVLPGKERSYDLTWAPKNSFGLYRAEIEIQNVTDFEFEEVSFFSFTGSGVVIFVLLIFVVITVFSLSLRKLLCKAK